MTQEDLMPFVKGLLKKKRKDNRNENVLSVVASPHKSIFHVISFFIAEGETVAAQDP